MSQEWGSVESEPVITEKVDPKIHSWRALTWRDKLLVLVAPLILIGVAVNHQILTATQNLDPWKGGGFGMFSTVDSRKERRISAFGITKDGRVIGERTTYGGNDLNEISNGVRARVLPNNEVLRPIAQFFYASLENRYAASSRDDVIMAVRIEVTTLEFDSNTQRISTKLVKKFEMSVP